MTASMNETTANAAPRSIRESIERSQWVLDRQTEGLSHADSLRQPAPRGNCLNWVLGHIALHREFMLATLGHEPVLSQEALARYVRGSQPITGDGDGVLPLDELLATLSSQQERLSSAIDTMPAESFTAPVQAKTDDPDATVLDELTVLAWHETYHLGQTEYLRQLSGVNDAVIS